jgi:hypothetical protein
MAHALGKIVILFFAALTLLRVAAAREAPVERPEILIGVDVGFNTAYRNHSWVPIDVTVLNERNDITGFVEVRTYGIAGELQSPVPRAG